MNAKSFAKSGPVSVHVNMSEDFLYTTTQNGTNPSSNTKSIHSQSKARPTLFLFVVGHFFIIHRRVESSVFSVDRLGTYLPPAVCMIA